MDSNARRRIAAMGALLAGGSVLALLILRSTGIQENTSGEQVQSLSSGQERARDGADGVDAAESGAERDDGGASAPSGEGDRSSGVPPEERPQSPSEAVRDSLLALDRLLAEGPFDDREELVLAWVNRLRRDPTLVTACAELAAQAGEPMRNNLVILLGRCGTDEAVDALVGLYGAFRDLPPADGAELFFGNSALRNLLVVLTSAIGFEPTGLNKVHRENESTAHTDLGVPALLPCNVSSVGDAALRAILEIARGEEDPTLRLWAWSGFDGSIAADSVALETWDAIIRHVRAFELPAFSQDAEATEWLFDAFVSLIGKRDLSDCLELEHLLDDGLDYPQERIRARAVSLAPARLAPQVYQWCIDEPSEPVRVAAIARYAVIEPDPEKRLSLACELLDDSSARIRIRAIHLLDDLKRTAELARIRSICEARRPFATDEKEIRLLDRIINFRPD